MSYDNLTTQQTSVKAQWGNNGVSYTAIALDSGVAHKDQLEVERIFTLSSGVQATISTYDLHRIFLLAKTQYTVNESTKTITAITIGTSSYTLTDGSNTTVTIPAIQAGETVVVRRRTASTTPYVTWVSGTRLTTDQLNRQVLQLMRLNQETLWKLENEYVRATDISGGSAAFGVNNSLDMKSNPIINLSNPTATFGDNGSNAVSKGYIESHFVNLDQNQAQTITGAKTFSGAATLSSTLAVTGATTLSSTLAVTGATTLSSTLGVTGATTLSSTLAVTGATTLSSATLSSTLGVTGATTLSSTLAVTGATTLSSTLLVQGQLTSNANAVINNISIGRGNGSYVENLCFGTSALSSTTATGIYNTAIGYEALKSNTGGGGNTAIGYQSLKDQLTGTYSTAVGTLALTKSTGSGNTAVGYAALISAIAGSQNTAIGASAGYSITTGDSNTLLGFQAGYNGGTNAITTGVNNICIGLNSAPTSGTVSNTITLGNSSIATLRCQVTAITALSDRRDKTNIVPLKTGLNFINSLNPVSFTWNMRDGGKVGIPEFGFIAQELQEAQQNNEVIVPNLINDDNPDRLEASQGTLIPILVKAIQELSSKIKDLESKVNKQ